MSLERGGRGDKEGNRYEDRFFAKLLLELLLEKLVSIEVEPLGKEGEGVEFVATAPDGERRYYQCKGANGANTSWRSYDLKHHNVFRHAKEHILSGKNHTYYFISPVPYDELDSLCNRARSCCGTEETFAEQVSNPSLRKWKKYCEVEFQETGEQLIYLLSQCYFELQPAGEGPRRDLEDLISLLFIEDDSHSATTIRILLERFANDQSYWGRPIISSDVDKWLRHQGIHQRMREQDSRCLPRIQKLNQTYKERFLAIDSGLIHRTETDKVLQHILAGKSVIVLGTAGTGKSGCLQEVIQALESQDVPYLSLSLDKGQPARSPDQYGRFLDLPDSPVATLFRVAGGRRCVLVFDQLDALRWTNSRTSSMLDVCKVMLRQIQQFNHLEHGQISCIFAVRSFDYETDWGLQHLLKPSTKDKEEQILWEEVRIGPLSEEDVQNIVGEIYPRLSSRLKMLLCTPSNLYVWTRIKDDARNTVTTLFQLMDEWWNQILSECRAMGVDANSAVECRDRLAKYMRNRETLFMPTLLFSDQRPIDALISCGMLRKVEKTVCFCHQSFLDYSLVVDDLNRIFQGERLPALMGGMDRQTPDVRYQLLMLVQYLSETDEEKFLEACQDLLEAPNIRYYFRCCAFEVLGQVPNPNRKHWELLSNYFEKPEWHAQIIRTIFLCHPAFIRLLAEQCPCYSWHKPEGRDCLRSIIQTDPELVWTILQNVGTGTMQADELYDIVEVCTTPTTQIFSFRIQLLIDNTNLLLHDFVLYDLIEHGYVQTVSVMKTWIVLEPGKRNSIHIPDEKVLEKYAKQHYRQVLNELLPLVLETAAKESANRYQSEWASVDYHISMERQIVQFMQHALNQEAKKIPEQFFLRISSLEQVESPIKQELLLHAMEHLPTYKADDVFEWLLTDFGQRAFEKTSFENSQLTCCKRIIQSFSPHCSECVFVRLEQAIVRWTPPRESMRATYETRISNHKVEGGGNYYGSFWGDLQRYLLPALDPGRTNNRTRELYRVLLRRFPNQTGKFDMLHMGMAHSVSSPIDGHLDKISDKSWLRLIADMSTYSPNQARRHWDIGTESSSFMFARSLSAAAKKEPARFAALSLQFPLNSYEGFTDAVIDAMDSLEVPLSLTCDVLRRFCKNPSAQIAISFARVLRKRAAENWPSDILQDLVEIACRHSDPEPDFSPHHFRKSNDELCCDDLLQSSINCARGCAFEAITELLWEHPENAEQFKTALEYSVEDKNPAVLFSVLHCAVPLYNIDKDFSKILFNRLLTRDLRILGAQQAWDLLRLFYKLAPGFYAQRLKTAIQSPVDDLKKYAVGMAASLVMMKCWQLEDLMSLPLTEQQMDAVCRQAIIHYKYDETRTYCEQLLRWLTDNNPKLPSLSLLFHQDYLQTSRDQNFIIELLGKRCGGIIVKDVLYYLKTNDVAAKDYSKILFAACKTLSEQETRSMRYHVNDLIFCVAQLFRLGKDDKDVLNQCLDIWDEVYHTYPLSVQPLADLLEQS